MRFLPFLVLLASCAVPPAQAEKSPPSDRPKDKAPPILTAHNTLRAKHCAPALTWSAELAKVAQAWADKLAKKCEFAHSGNRKYGENLAAGTAGTLDAEAVTGMWYEELAKYDFKKGGFSMETGHFTQLVWKSTSRLGCGMATCKGMDLWVCNYDPPGNVQGQYRAEVLPTSCRK